MPDDTERDALGVLDRMTAILEAFDDDDGGLGISQLAARAALPKSTVSRLVSTLVRQRYLERQGTRIHLGIRLFELGQLAEQPWLLRIAALPVMTDLRNRTGHNVHLAIPDGDEAVCIAVMRGRSPAASIARTGGRLPLHATALGKVMLAHGDDPAVDAVVARGWGRRTPHTVADGGALRRQLEDVRRAGRAVEIEEFAVGVCCVAAPVHDPRTGRLVAALSVSGSVAEVSAQGAANAVCGAALAVGRRLAGDPAGSASKGVTASR